MTVEARSTVRVRDPSRGRHGLPTNVVTLWAGREALKRAPLTVIGLLAARLSLAEVTQGVTVQGAAPDTNKDIGVALALLLMATMTTVPSAGFLYAVSSTPDGMVPEVETRVYPGRTKREKLPMTQRRLVQVFVLVS